MINRMIGSGWEGEMKWARLHVRTRAAAVTHMDQAALMGSY